MLFLPSFGECSSYFEPVLGLNALFRPPYGEYNQNVEDVADELGQTSRF